LQLDRATIPKQVIPRIRTVAATDRAADLREGRHDGRAMPQKWHPDHAGGTGSIAGRRRPPSAATGEDWDRTRNCRRNAHVVWNCRLDGIAWN